MAITLDIPPDVEARLNSKAALTGQDLGAYLRGILERVAAASVPGYPTDAELAEMNSTRHLSLLDLEGVGAEIWDGIDAQTYVSELRREWDDHT